MRHKLLSILQKNRVIANASYFLCLILRVDIFASTTPVEVLAVHLRLALHGVFCPRLNHMILLRLTRDLLIYPRFVNIADELIFSLMKLLQAFIADSVGHILYNRGIDVREGD